MLFSASCATSRLTESKSYFALISKEDMSLSLCDFNSQLIMECDIACGKNYGDKQMEGDMKTPEGRFSVSEIVDARLWTHDFGDGKGEIKGAYGSHFIRLETPPHTGIGIHGTHDESSIGTRATEGCIRLHKRDLKRFVSYVYIGMPIIITSSHLDSSADE